MSIPKERATQDSNMSLIQACSFYSTMCGGNLEQALDGSSAGVFGFENYHKLIAGDGDGMETSNGSPKINYDFGHLPSLIDPSTAKGIAFTELNSYQSEEAQFVINFKAGRNNSMHSYESFLSFEQGEERCSKTHQKDEYTVLGNHVMQDNYQWNQTNPNSSNESHSSEDLNCLETASSYNNVIKDTDLGKEGLTWLYSGGGPLEESRGAEANLHKRPYGPHMGGQFQAPKKQCVGSSKKHNPKIISSKDPQSIAAKNRRERISERLKILQDLVPNGSKVDLVTMLEKAISYVKFLQLQVKVLATDEFWPTQGGKAPEVSQVKEAIDAILTSYKDRNSSSTT